MNSENSKASHTNRLLIDLSDEINLKRSDKYVTLSNLYYTQQNIKNLYKYNVLKISAPTWADEFELRNG